jgi:hypothetical protein
LRQRRDAKNQGVEAVEPLASLLRQHAKDQCADHRADQRHGRKHPALGADLVDAVSRQRLRQHQTDRRDVVAIAEDAQPGDEQRPHVKAMELLLVDRGELALGHASPERPRFDRVDP